MSREVTINLNEQARGPVGPAGASDWDSISGKPATFTPSAHTQAASTISDSTTAGRAILTAADVDGQRALLGLDVINVKLAPYNAIGDGESDDTAEIQAAIDAAGNTKSARMVYLPAGTYKITSALVIKLQGTSIIGDGIFSTTINQTTSSAHAIKWDSPNNVQYTAVRNLSLTGVGGDTSTGTALYARSDTGPGNFFASQFLIDNVRVTGFQNGFWSQNSPKVSITNCLFLDFQVGIRLTKADTFLIENVAMGASGVTAPTTGIILENSSAPIVSGSNFGGVVKLGEFGDLDRFMDVTGGSVVTVIEPNVERCGAATTQEAVYLAGTAKMTWIGGRISNGSGDSTMAIFRLYCDSGGDVPTLQILGTPKLDGGSIRVIESYGGLSGKSTISALGSARLAITYATTAGGTSYNTGYTSPFNSFGGISSMTNTSTARSLFGYIPGSGDGFPDLALVTAKDAAGTYARRNIINDALIKVINATATVTPNTSTTATTLFTATVPANTFTAARQTLRVKAFGKFAANGNNKRIQVDFGGSVAIYDSGALAINDNDWMLDIVIVYQASGNFTSMVSSQCDDALWVNKIQNTKTIARFNNQTNIVNIVGTGGATSDIELLWAHAEWVKNESEY